MSTRVAFALATIAAMLGACGGDEDGPVPDEDAYRGLYRGTMTYGASSCPPELTWDPGLEVEESLEVATSTVQSTLRFTGPTGRQYMLLGLEAMLARVEDGDLLASGTLRAVPEGPDCTVTFAVDVRARLDAGGTLAGTVTQRAAVTDGGMCTGWVDCSAVIDLEMEKL
ncbi:MAG: hypothetical protein IT379_27700 [Deltaproteobacteria bacterium]|nr:hypothetical protein [Deltaproteobacteria bacterium]